MFDVRVEKVITFHVRAHVHLHVDFPKLSNACALELLTHQIIIINKSTPIHDILKEHNNISYKCFCTSYANQML